MDIKPTKYKKGDMVRYYRMTSETLGIVKSQRGARVEVEWVLWPFQQTARRREYPMYNLISVEKGD